MVTLKNENVCDLQACIHRAAFKYKATEGTCILEDDVNRPGMCVGHNLGKDKWHLWSLDGL